MHLLTHFVKQVTFIRFKSAILFLKFDFNYTNFPCGILYENQPKTPGL